MKQIDNLYKYTVFIEGLIMQVEITVDKRNQEQLPKSGLSLIEAELKKRLSRKYPAAETRVRFASATSVNVSRATKDEAKAIRKLVTEMFDESDEWLVGDL